MLWKSIKFENCLSIEGKGNNNSVKYIKNKSKNIKVNSGGF